MPDIDKIINSVKNGNGQIDRSHLSYIDEDSNHVKESLDTTQDYFGSLGKQNRMSNILLGENKAKELEESGESLLNEEVFRPQFDVERLKARDQSALNQLWHSVSQLVVNEIGLGTIEGFADIFDAIYKGGSHLLNKLDSDIGTPWEDNDYRNSVSEKMEELQNSFKENVAPIYRENPSKSWDVGDFAWWADNAVSIGSTLALLLPSKGIAGVAGKLAKAAKIDRIIPGTLKAISKETGIASTGKALRAGSKANDFISTLNMATLSRIAENYQEGRQAYDSSKNLALDYLNNFSDEEKEEFFTNNPEMNGKSNEEIAHILANRGANQAFKNDMWLLIFDFLQYKSLNNMFKEVPSSKPVGIKARVRQEQVLNKLAGIEKEYVPGVIGKLSFAKDYLKDAAKYAWKHPLGVVETAELTEAIEEGWQGIQGKKADELVNMYFNPTIKEKALETYLKDPEILEQAFWGALGGIAFQKAGSGFNHLGKVAEGKYKLYKDRNKAEDDRTKFTKTDYENLVRGETKRSIAEIENRTALIENLRKQLQDVKNGINPYTREQIQSSTESDYLMEQVKNDFITEFTLNAADTGNIGLLKEFIKDKRFNDYIKEQGLDVDMNFENSLKEQMNKVQDLYAQAKEDLTNSINVDNIDLGNAVARYMVRQQLTVEELENKINEEESDLSKSLGHELWDGVLNTYFYTNHITSELKRVLSLYKDLDKKYNNKELSKSALESEKQRLQSYVNSLIDFGIQTGRMNILDEENDGTESYATIQDRINKFKDLNTLDEVEGTKLANLIEHSAKSLAQKSGYDNFNNIPMNIIKKNQQIIVDNINRFRAENNIPKTQKEFQELYDDNSVLLNVAVTKRLNEAISSVRKYLRNNIDNLDEAVDNLLKEENIGSDERNAMEILKVGSQNTTNLSLMFYQEVEKIRKEINDNKEDENKVIDDGTQTTAEEAKKENDRINEGLNEQNEDEKTNNDEDESSSNDSSTGEETLDEDPIPDDAGIYYEEDDEGKISEKEAKELAERYGVSASEENEFETQARAFAKTREILIANPALRNSLNSTNYGSDEFNRILNEIREQLIDDAICTPADAEKYARGALLDFINLLIFNNRENKSVEGKQKVAALKKLKSAMVKAASSLNINENASSISQISPEEMNKVIEDILQSYFDVENKFNYKTPDGKTVVRVDALIDYLKKIVEEDGMSFTNLCNIISNIFSYINTVGSNGKYIFEGKIINSTKSLTFDDLNEIFAELYRRSNIVEVKEDNFHFEVSNNLKDKYGKLTKKGEQILRNLKNKKVYAEIVEVDNQMPDGSTRTEKMSIGLFIDDENGDQVEIGYIARVKSNSTNTEFEKVGNSRGLNLGVRKLSNGSFKITNEAIDNIFNKIIDATIDDSDKDAVEFMQFLTTKLIADNPELEIVDNSDMYSQPSDDDYIKLINNKYFKEFINNTSLEYKGKTITLNDFKEFNSETVNKINYIAQQINGIVYYPYLNSAKTRITAPLFSNLSYINIRQSYDEYAEKLFNNYKQTSQLEQALENGSAVNIQFVNTDNTSLNYSQGERKGINKIGINTSTSTHPVVWVNDSQADTMIDEQGNVYPNKAGFTPGTMGIVMDVKNGMPMIAIFRDSNSVSSSKEIGEAVSSYIFDAINNYYNSSENSVEAYNTLLNSFRNLFSGKNKLFKGINIKVGSNGFTIFASDGNTTTPIIDFFRYAATYKDGQYYDFKGNPISKEELQNYYGKNARLYIKDKKVPITNNESKTNKDRILSLVNLITNNLKFAKTNLINEKEDTDILKHTENGIEIHIGNKVFKYKNFTDFFVKTNAFNTTHSGRTKDQIYSKTNSGPINSIFTTLNFETEKEISDERASSSLATMVADKLIEEDKPYSGTDVLVYIGFEGQSKQLLDEIDKKLDKDSIIPKEVYFDSKTNRSEFAVYDKKTGRITVYTKGIAQMNLSPDIGLRLLVHERFHQLVDTKKFFTDKKYGTSRVNELIETYKQFEQSIQSLDESEDIHRFHNEFESKYGKFKDSEDLKERELLANEWAAEVISNKYMMDYLNNVDYVRNDNVVVSKRKSLFQKIIDILLDLFNLNNINKGTILEGFYNALGYPSTLNTFDEENKKNDEQSTNPVEEVVDTSSNEASEEVVPEDLNPLTEKGKELFGDIELDDTYMSGLDDGMTDDVDYDEDYSIIEGINNSVGLTTEEIQLEEYAKNKGFNPNGLSIADDMEQMLSQYPRDKRHIIEQEISEGRLKYICR